MTRKFKIMVVEDEIVVAMDLRNRLESWGYDVTEVAASGEAAIRVAKTERPDLALMDIRLRGKLDGTETAIKIRRIMDIPMIFLTAHTDQDYIDRSKISVPHGFIIKPFKDKELQVMIELALYKHRMSRKLTESERKYRRLAEFMNEGLAELDASGIMTYANKRLCEMFGVDKDEIEGRSVLDFIDCRDHPFFGARVGRPKRAYISHVLGRAGGKTTVIYSFQKIRKADGEVKSGIAVFTDVSELKKIEDKLKRANRELERRVKERTRQLEIKTFNLEELNTALKVLLDKRGEDKKILEERILSNMRELVDPYIEKMKNTNLDDTQKAFVDILESNLSDIISPFTRTLATRYHNLTPQEMQVANLVKQGKTTRYIASLLNLSRRTIESHRRNIRIKLGLKNKKANLRTFLTALK